MSHAIIETSDDSGTMKMSMKLQPQLIGYDLTWPHPQLLHDISALVESLYVKDNGKDIDE